ncbi:hypothetical protein A3C18_03995 [Candidatus Kaiserbacteria bacterium RIFCSPHIGHO2_02_FULL_54_11b]|uniref:Uncharacterized protein n=2 Tax=Candidatus Kaiseribacteriota TaxID=1752734 RepID=A0A1F6CIM4_9BACT|nr:MAG: hypothetical protein A2704_06645 [Candidatus Kaiserbacteria bacterium RIFCSPHIGHO2_01_FULL_54_36b]OGG64428.1 MAG: hypothetical protein A3C18_03995 [Candidatus Kaiserbacteria bacterium RIFCSPHIGHO2_02_FULL_54_11b]
MVNELRKSALEIRAQKMKERHTPAFSLLSNQITGNPSHNQADNRAENIKDLYAKMRDDEKEAFKTLIAERRVFLQSLLDSGNVTGGDWTTCKTNLKDLNSIVKAIGLDEPES